MPKKVYLVEDNPLTVQLLGKMLEEVASAQVIGSAATEAEACNWLQAHGAQWDLAVLDLGLARGTGLGVWSCPRITGHGLYAS